MSKPDKRVMKKNEPSDTRREVPGAGTPRKPVELPRPTPDQQNYLEEMTRAVERYDPAEIVGGPRIARS